jgi:hypothetical protein
MKVIIGWAHKPHGKSRSNYGGKTSQKVTIQKTDKVRG